MLRLKKIVKDYTVADMKVHALKGIDLSFRKNEFVSILGPSGCGKTTLLNIIGGLDKYTSGDLFIAGKSTKEFTDRDWDVYRNHRIGFIFQSYNLIPHQNILSNVELALTIAGLDKQERVERAKKALDRVGLKDQYTKKPNQLSGGQCQRVAIARALVNEPEILLADEPTGALDTVTSVQIMDLIKEIANERLVIMVTHNPELAEKYSTRIVNLLDGEVKDDSNPFSEDEEIKEIEELNKTDENIETKDTDNKNNKNQKEKAKMSLWTAFKLSAKNLYSKFKRTAMVVIAGSIGIIGVCSVLSVSTGVQDYIDVLQDDMLSGNPIKVTKSGIDYTTLMNTSTFQQKKDALDSGNWVNVNSIIDFLVSHEDELSSLKYNNEISLDYVNYLRSMPSNYYRAMSFNYGINVLPNIYTDFTLFKKDENNNPINEKYDAALDAKFSRRLSLHAITETYTAMLEETDYSEYSKYITALSQVLQQGISDKSYIEEQYDLVAGDLSSFENDANKFIVVLSSDQELSDLLLAQLGYYAEDEFYNMIFKAAPDLMIESKDEFYDERLDRTKFSYDEILNKKFYYYPNDEVYTTPVNATAGDISYISSSHIYSKTEADTPVKTLEIAAIVKPKKTISYGSLKSGFIYNEKLAREMVDINKNSEIAKAINVAIVLANAMSKTKIDAAPIRINYNIDYAYANTDNLRYEYKGKETYVEDSQSGITSTFISYIMGGSSSGVGNGFTTMSLNTVAASYVPTSISIYPNDFNNKNLVTDYLDRWNSKDKLVFQEYDKSTAEATGRTITLDANAETRTKIKYTDSVALIIDMINQMINIITYALIAFTSLALLVSTVMVGIITYVSVVERVKEIGVIRSLGGRKKDVSHLFNAETFVIGLASGIFGVLVTGVLSIVANIIVNSASDGAVKSIAHLTWSNAGIMILLSVMLTLIAGLIPARSAAKKNPVDALRSE